MSLSHELIVTVTGVGWGHGEDGIQGACMLRTLMVISIGPRHRSYMGNEGESLKESRHLLSILA